MSLKPEWWTSDEWATPQSVVDMLGREFGPFDLDACCRPETAKASMYYTKASDGLTAHWFGCVYVNPPYSDPGPWIRRAVAAVGAGDARRVVMLLPASTDTNWFHDDVLPNADVYFVRGRIKFLGWQGAPIGSPKAGSIVAVFPKRPQTVSVRP